MEGLMSVADVSKTFVSTRALDRVDFDVRAGEVHALIGHNGSGKSTLVKVLAGFHKPDPGSGAFTVDGQKVPYGDPEAVHRAGLRFIHQELGLLDDLTLLENLRLGDRYLTGHGWRVRWGAERRRAEAALAIVGLDLDPDIKVEELTPIERTQVAVARAMQDEAAVRVVLLDEPTATLPSSEVTKLFELIRRMTARGVGIVYVSHRLEEIEEIADRITVLREGRVVGAGPRSEFDTARLVSLIVGSSAGEVVPAAAREATRVHGEGSLLDFQAVTAGELRGADFTIRTGEIVGVAGLAGSGVHDIPGVLLGRVPVESGHVVVAGRVIDDPDPAKLRPLGAAVLPSPRHLKGIPDLTIRENLTLADLRPLTRGWNLDLRRERREAAEIVERFDVKPRQPEQPLAELSGGNQQKVAVAKWLRIEPDLLVLDEPTQGVDVGAKAEILDLVATAAADGLAVVLCSSDLDDLEAVCSRVLVIRGGLIATELTGRRINRKTITEECYRSEKARVS
ncbi:MAG TPA: sugar ABC transporter ATP-binding protein [Solirubrobacterales bacterium]|nr:sugar ABC transporter ATP-binding protein [Solirubrobacterales bacterium]